jgi:hypothetical protein
MGGSNRLNLNPQISHMRQMSYETSRGGKLVLPAIKLAAEVMRRFAGGAPHAAAARPESLC